MTESPVTSSFPGLIAAAVPLVDAALDSALPPADAAPARLHEAMRYAIFAGGKRVRPALVLGACRACGGGDADAAPAMAGVELLHTYTLVHDDLPAMDDDDLRRGRPTVHKAYDEATAILVGDALQTLAFQCVGSVSGDAAVCLAEATGSLGVVGGQQDDLDAEGRALGQPDDAELLQRIHSRKTAALIRASCELGAIAAGADAEARQRLATFGEDVGLAFQITDDILDCTADEATLGKTPGKDAASGKLTWVALHGLDGARAEAKRLIDEALEAVAVFGAGGEALVELGRFIGSRDR